MRKGWLGRVGMAAFLGLSVMATGGGCAEEREPISQVQPNYVKKLDLLGPDKDRPTEWYMRMTVTEVQRSNEFAFPGYQDELRRIRWDVQEQYLIARRSYELVSGSDGKGADPRKNDGVIVAMFPITMHFDIRRAYNPLTREEQNILVPNTTDRPWWEREFMYVDWSRNLVTDPDFQGLWIGEIFGDIQWQPVQYYVTDPTSPNAPVADTANGYMDFTSKWVSKAVAFNGISWLPSCILMNWYGGSDTMECNDQEISVRTSFLKVGDRDYEPFETDSSKFAMFGTFNRDRYGYSREYGITDDKWHRLAARHNLWQKSHDDRECFASGNKLEADAMCASVPGSVCDPYGGESQGKKGLCTIPYKDRPVRTIAYHVSKSMPADLWDMNQELVNEWNEALVDSIAVTREVECRRLGGDQATCHAQFYDGDVPKGSNGPALVLCHNPVIEGDNQACGKVGTSAREGDLRYNLIGWVDQPLARAPLGYGPNGADPLTGEVIQSTAYIYGASHDSYAAMARDLVAVANGDIDTEAFAKGTFVNGNLDGKNPLSAKDSAAFAGFAERLAAGVKSSGMSAAEIAARMKAIQPEQMVAKIGASSAAVDGLAGVDKLAAVNAMIADKGIHGAAGFGGRAEAEANIKSVADKLAGSKSEAELIGTADWVSANGILGAGDPATLENMRKVTSPFGGSLSPFAMADVQQKMFAALEAKGICMYGLSEFNAPHLEGLALKFMGKYQDLPKEERQQKVYAELRASIYRAVTEHELGHTMALRHNFQGSWDAINYHPNYWKLRTANGTKTAACNPSSIHDEKTDTCMGPRYLDRETNAEMGIGTDHPAIEEYAYSSIMDYGYDFNTDLVGLGSYDRAAMKFIYGNVVETFPAGSAVASQLASLHAIPAEYTPRGPVSEQWWVKRNDPLGGGNKVQPTHYTTLARIMQGEKAVALYDEARCRDANGSSFEAHSAIDGKICLPPAKDHAHISEMESGKLTGIDDDVEALYWRSKDGRIRWPYRFGTDEYASSPHNLRFDAGADVYEAAVNVSRLYEYRYLLDYWRRGRRGWIPFFMGGRLWDRYFSRMHSIGWLAASKISQYAAMDPAATPETNDYLTSDDWGRGYTLAMSTLFDTIQRSITRPQPGQYAPKVAVPGQAYDLWEVPDFAAPDTSAPVVSILDGRWIDDDMNTYKGGSFHYQSFIDRYGAHVEKPLAVAALSVQFPPMHVYYDRDSYVDGRNVLLNFRSVMPKAYDRLLGGIMALDTDLMAPTMDTSKVVKDPAGNRIASLNWPQLWDDTYDLNPRAVDATTGSVVQVDPLVGFRLQVPALLYTFWFGQDDASMTIAHSLRVWAEGGPEALPLKDDEKVFFYEPDSGITWASRKTAMETQNGLLRPTGPGHRMIMKANQLLAAAYDVQVDADGMPVYDATTHRPVWTTTPDKIKDLTAYQTLRRYIGILNVMRQYQHDMRGDLKL